MPQIFRRWRPMSISLLTVLGIPFIIFFFVNYFYIKLLLHGLSLTSMLFSHSWKEKWVHAFHKGISAMLNANCFSQILNSFCQFISLHFATHIYITVHNNYPRIHLKMNLSLWTELQKGTLNLLFQIERKNVQ